MCGMLISLALIEPKSRFLGSGWEIIAMSTFQVSSEGIIILHLVAYILACIHVTMGEKSTTSLLRFMVPYLHC